MTFELFDLGGSRGVPAGDPLRDRAQAGAPVALVIGGDADARAAKLREPGVLDRQLVLVELGTECLGMHTGEDASAPAHVLGFARFRLGALAASPLVEIVRRPGSAEAALAQARELFAQAGLEVAVCTDVPGRIVDSLLRPYLNSALRSVDEGLAAPADLDQALRLGLGFPKGPVELLEASGLVAHFEVSSALHEALGAAEFVPARRARVEAMRAQSRLREGQS